MSPFLIPDFHPLDPEGTLYFKNDSDLVGLGKYEIQFQVGQVLQILIRNPNNKHIATVSPLATQFYHTDFSTWNL